MRVPCWRIESRVKSYGSVGGRPPTIFVPSSMTTHSKAKPRVCRAPSLSNRNARLPRGRSGDIRATDEESAAGVMVSNIQWITDKELDRVSQDLRRLKRIGRRLEQHGDYFGSGNLAYQLRQVVAEIRALVRGTSRVQHRN